MHELSLVSSIVTAVAGRAAGRRVEAVQLRIGALSGVDPRALRFCFDLCARGTTLDGARLDIEEVPGKGRCASCGAELQLAEPILRCWCGGPGPVTLFSGDEFMIQSMEVCDV